MFLGKASNRAFDHSLQLQTTTLLLFMLLFPYYYYHVSIHLLPIAGEKYIAY